MRFSRVATMAMAGVAVAIGLVTAVGAAPFGTASNPPDALRALAKPVGLHIGTAVIPFDLNTPEYAQVVANQFSSVTPENETKWQVVEPTQGVLDFSGADRLVTFAKQNGQLVRGTTLLWHNQLPSWLITGVANGTISTDQLRDLLHQHITTEVSHFKGEIWQWDVASEFFTDSNPSTINPNDFWVSHLGAGVIADAFRWAHAADPKAQLFYNDYGIAGEDGTNAKSDAVFAWLQQLQAQGVPISGVGDEGHLDTQFGFPTKLTADLDRFASLDLKLAITQADVRTFVDGPATQVPTDHLAVFAQPYEFSQLLKACLLVRQCTSFTVWGVADADSWVPGIFTAEGYATLYDVNLQPKPAYTDLQQDLQLAVSGAPHRSAGDAFGGDD